MSACARAKGRGPTLLLAPTGGVPPFFASGLNPGAVTPLSDFLGDVGRMRATQSLSTGPLGIGPARPAVPAVLAAGVEAPVVVSPLTEVPAAPTHVLGVGHRLAVAGAHTSPVVAQVVEVEPLGDGALTAGEHPCDAVGLPRAEGLGVPAVPAGVLAADPLPAPVGLSGLGDVGPEGLGLSDSSFGHGDDRTHCHATTRLWNSVLG